MDITDIGRSARQCIDQYGMEASVYAAKKADAMLQRGDLNGFNAWMRIGRAIEKMQATGGGTKH